MATLDIRAAGAPNSFILQGELDLYTMDRLGEIDFSREGDLYLDLSQLTFIDQAGVSALASLGRSRERSGVVFLCSAPTIVERLVKLSRMIEWPTNLVLASETALVTQNGKAKPRSGLGSVILSEQTLPDTLALAAETARVTCKAEFAAVLLKAASGKPLTASTVHLAEDLDRLQSEFGGPGVLAMQTGQLQVVNSMLSERRWPEFTNKALYSGVLGVLSLPLAVSEEVFGAVNLYAQREGAFPEEDRNHWSEFATECATLLKNSQQYWSAVQLGEQLTEALESRSVIDQAKGMLMLSLGVTADEAFDRLKALSQRANTKVRVIAHDIVESRLGSASWHGRVVR